MSKGPFDKLALKLTDRLFSYDVNVGMKNNTSDIDKNVNCGFNVSEDSSVKSSNIYDERALEIKKAKVYYSINLLLNESSKLLILAILAILLHVFVKYVFCLVILMLTRSILGGLHGKNYWQCLLITMICVGTTIYISPLIIVNKWVAICIMILWCFLVIVDGPIQSKNRLTIKHNKRKKNKIYLVIISIVLFILTNIMGTAYNQAYLFLLLFQMFGIAVT